MVTFLQGDCLEVLKTLPSESIQCVVTSPPYYGLRDYGVSGQIGLEQSPEEYVGKMVDVFREVWRVLRKDGTVWLVLGDSYAGSNKGYMADGTQVGGKKQMTNKGSVTITSGKQERGRGTYSGNGLKPKDLIGIPWMTAFALRADGWWLRSDIIWNKLNPMPESVTDRPTKSHEYMFLLTKSSKYYYDAQAILVPAAYDGRKDTRMKGSTKYPGGFVPPGDNPNTLHVKGHERWPKRLYPTGNNQSLHDYKHSGYWKEDGTPLFVTNSDGQPARNKRTVWTIPTKPYKGAHFATYPPALVEPCILAGTSEKGCCPECGKPWKRVVVKIPPGRHESEHQTIASGRGKGGDKSKNAMPSVSNTTGWQPTCTCHGHFETIKVQESYMARATGTHDDKKIYIPDDNQPEPVPCVVLDPFCGSGTTGEVSIMYGRDFIGIELNPEYIELAKKRLSEVQMRLKL